MNVNIFHHRYRYVFILLLAGYSYLNILFTSGDQLLEMSLAKWQFFTLILFVVLLVWEIDRWLWKQVDRRFTTPSSRIVPLVPYFLLSLVNVLLSSLVVVYVTTLWQGEAFTENISLLKLALAFAFRINLFLHTVNAIVYFNRKLVASRLEAEQLKTLSAESQFEALRNQINPHFLFNSFNVLTELVHKDANVATEFIQQLSRVYRYLLYNQESETVTLKAEIEFVEAFIFLLKIRFAESIIIHTNLSEHQMESYAIPPAALQIPVENAIKHNIVSRKQPLTVEIFLENNHLVIRNNLQRRQTYIESGGLGLQNIQQRFAYLTQQEVQIEENETHFTVKLPLVENVAV
ncbi:sensor histidine kinase [Tunicatimonas pelagia]|uniref:sensor histidine kinase n=1 Tax=Tunicatimonas pelagia TaxID=931531 RepID=UPI0026661D8F|nr:histidine kinase [Tunicatimonas pelagia]WKN41640.1 histidine kinase [Tunicatimonas pelagia]